ncbi:MAG: ribonuclease Z [Maribacter sp.]|nr:ribonuclease Z [Maribacter sp.]NNK76705.1 ribonuclease Z [Maribacter sp.]
MIFDKEGTTTVIFQENIALQEFLENLEQSYAKVSNDNIIVNLFSFSALNAGDILEFLPISNKHRDTKKSFVLVTNKVTIDEVPEELCVVPTIQEAKDIIEMEEIERDLDI